MPAPVPTPPSTANSSSGQSPDNAHFRVVRRRNRVPLSCAPCRTRKLKCNRGHPCDNCTKRGDGGSCSYAAPTTRKKPGTGSGQLATPDDMQNRIDRLENLVLSLMTTESAATGPAAAQAAINSARSSSLATTTNSEDIDVDVDEESMVKEGHGDDSDVNDVSQRIGVMKVDGRKTIFASDAHWYSILADITEVKHYFASHHQQLQDHYRRVMAAREGPASADNFIFKAPRLNDRTEVLAPFPTKTETDRLVGRYFTSYDPSVHIIHGPTFQKLYDRHWLDPNQTPLPFIGMLYAIMALALQSYQRANDEPPEYIGKSLELSVAFRRLTAQTLVLADIKDADPQILETLVLHLQAEYARTRDCETSVLILVSLVVRMAMRMGYHRDPAPYTSIKPFQAEMRRRVWAFIRQSDLLFSFQFGMPSIARGDCIDTQIPRNLYDDEIYEDMPALPPARPDNEATPASYMIAKARLLTKFGEIVDRVSSITNPPSYEEVVELDRQLREVKANNPPHLQLRPFPETDPNNANLTLQRFGLELLYLKSQCVLHRRFIARGRESQRFAYSRRTCIDASMDMLAHQATLHYESQPPNGRLSSVKWFISSLTTHDFLLAAMMICLDLYHSTQAEVRDRKSPTSSNSPQSADVWAADRKEAMMNALRHCVAIWESQRDQSMELYKASSMLKVMVEKLMAQQARPGSGDVNPASTSRGPRYMFPNGQVNMSEDAIAPEHSAAMTLGLLSSGGVSPNPFGGNGQAAPSSSQEARPYPASMAGLLNEPLPERTGMTPPGAANAASPFTSLFGASAIEGLSGADIDWGAWDSFVQGSGNVDPIGMWANGMGNMDMGGVNFAGNANGNVDPQLSGQGMGQQGLAGVFMGGTGGQS